MVLRQAGLGGWEFTVMAGDMDDLPRSEEVARLQQTSDHLSLAVTVTPT